MPNYYSIQMYKLKTKQVLLVRTKLFQRYTNWLNIEARLKKVVDYMRWQNYYKLSSQKNRAGLIYLLKIWTVSTHCEHCWFWKMWEFKRQYKWRI